MASATACDEAGELEMMDEGAVLLELPPEDSNSGPTEAEIRAQLRAASIRAKRVTRFETRRLEQPSVDDDSGSGGSSYYRLTLLNSDSNLRAKRLHDHHRFLTASHHSDNSNMSGLAPRLSLLNDEPVEIQPPSTPYAEDLCQLCKSPQSGEAGVGLQLDERPGVIHWRKLPCRCPDRYLHVECLETRFFEDAIYSSGRRRLFVTCCACSDSFRVTHHRGRRSCDDVACTSFARHLVLATVTSGVLIGFGLWSMLHPVGGQPRLVNCGMVGAGCLILAVFLMHEVWLLYCRYEFEFSRVEGSGKAKPAGENNA